VLKRYRNALFQLAQEGGVDVTRLRGVEGEVGGNPTFTIRYRETPLVFIIRHPADNPHSFDYASTRFGAVQPKTFSFGPSNWLSFDSISSRFSKWVADEVRAAIEDELLPDLWLMLEGGEELSPVSDATPFTVDERSQLKLGLETFKVLIAREFQPTEDQASVISDRLDYLAAGVDRLNRFDWRGVAISTLMGISITLGLDTDRGRALYILFQQALTSVMHLLK
jgi:hypothetical protein